MGADNAVPRYGKESPSRRLSYLTPLLHLKLVFEDASDSAFEFFEVEADFVLDALAEHGAHLLDVVQNILKEFKGDCDLQHFPRGLHHTRQDRVLGA